MNPKDPVYKLHGAIKRIEDAIPNKDAEGWLRDKLAADRIGWAYRQIEEQHGRRWTSFIDIPPRAAIMEEPDLEIDWSKGMATIQQRYSRGISGSKIRKKPVECEIVILRRDLDRELANSIAPSEATEPTVYTPPFVEFMNRAIQELGLDVNTKIMKKIIVEWFRGNWHEGLGEFSERKIDLMATLIRRVEDQKGGRFDSRRDN